jgi:uroporphyrinogen III methyltransferase/synthase
MSSARQPPLSGIRVMVTRPKEQAAALSCRLAELGAEVVSQPVIRIGEPTDWAPVDEAIAAIRRFDWLVFSSSNGVRFLLDRYRRQAKDMRLPEKLKLAAIGPGTAEKLVEYQLSADLVPPEYRAESLAAALIPAAQKNQRFLLVRASRGREVLAERLTAAGGQVTQVVAYTSSDVDEPDPEVSSRLASGEIDWIAVTSSAIARSLVALFGDKLRQSRLMSISPVTSATIRQLGYEPHAEAGTYTMSGVVDAIVQQAGCSGFEQSPPTE